MIRCGICGAPYGHKIAGCARKYNYVNEHERSSCSSSQSEQVASSRGVHCVWICNTYNTLGKAHCPSQQIPDDILQAKIAEAGGMDGLQEILVPGPYTLSFKYNCQLSTLNCQLSWAHPSRRNSWTPEMREAAREKSLKGAKTK